MTPRRAPKSVQALRYFVVASVLALALPMAACDDSSAPHENLGPAPTTTSPTGNNGVPDGGSGSGPVAFDDAGNPLDCYPDPKTHDEIINRCTTSEKVDKTPNLPLLGPNGELPQLP